METCKEDKMKILVINAGSSSLKYQLIDMENEKVIAKGLCERIAIDGSRLTHKANGKEYETPLTSVWVHPVDTNIDSVKCSIQLEDSYRKGVFTAIGICLLIAWLLIRLSFQKQKKIKRQDK